MSGQPDDTHSGAEGDTAAAPGDVTGPETDEGARAETGADAHPEKRTWMSVPWTLWASVAAIALVVGAGASWATTAIVSAVTPDAV